MERKGNDYNVDYQEEDNKKYGFDEKFNFLYNVLLEDYWLDEDGKHQPKIEEKESPK